MNHLRFIKTNNLLSKASTFVCLIILSGCISSGLNTYEKYPVPKRKEYTPSEIATINHNFETNPTKFSQEYGELTIWKIFEKNPKLSLKLTEIKELKDGINSAEAKALNRIYLFTKDIYSKETKVENNESIVDRSEFLQKIQCKGTDSLRDFFVFCTTNSNEDLFNAYQKQIYIRKKEILDSISQVNQQLATELKKVPEIKEGNEFSTIEALDDILYLMRISTPEDIKNLNDYFRVGIPAYRKFCTPVQALVWLAEDGEFSKSNNPLNDSWYETVKRAWKNMSGERWDNKPRQAMARLNHPMLTNYWLRRKMRYVGSIRNNYFDDIYKNKVGYCKDFANFSTKALFASGWKNVYSFRVDWGGMLTPGHYVSILKLDYTNLDSNLIYGFFDYNKIRKRLEETHKPLYWIIADGGGKEVRAIRGPFKDYKSIAYRIVHDFGATLIAYRPVW